MSPALADEFLTTGSLGKSWHKFLTSSSPTLCPILTPQGASNPHLCPREGSVCQSDRRPQSPGEEVWHRKKGRAKPLRCVENLLFRLKKAWTTFPPQLSPASPAPASMKPRPWSLEEGGSLIRPPVLVLRQSGCPPQPSHPLSAKHQLTP